MLKKMLFYLMPISLLGFIFFQNCSPLLRSTNALGFMAKNAVIAKAKAEVPNEPAFALKKVKDGIYYTFKADYNCVPTKNPKAQAIPSHVDSYGIAEGKICHLGNICNEEFKCLARLPAGMVLAKDEKSLTMDGHTFKLQKSPYPENCEMPSCAPPPGNCRYSTPAPLDGNGCAVGCGTMICKTDVESCPRLDCSVPPENCSYDGLATRDKNNCPKSCGKIVCDTLNPKGEVACPKLDCQVPPENCHYDRSFKRDARGCKLGCGNLTCDRLDPKAVVCKPIECASPPMGCSYEGEPTRDKDGCKVSCGSLACVKNTPAKCKIPQCDPAPVNCRYDGNSPLDFEGCSSGCGNLICNSEVPL